MRNSLFYVLIGIILLSGIVFSAMIPLTGTVIYAHNMSYVNGANVTVYNYTFGQGPPQLAILNTTNTNVNGSFNLSFNNESGTIFALRIFKYNESNYDHLLYISNPLPELPASELISAIGTLNNANLSIGVVSGAVLHVNATNSTGNYTNFGYFVKDTTYGNTMSSSGNATDAYINLVASKNYTIEFYRDPGGSGGEGSPPRMEFVYSSNLTTNAVNNVFHLPLNLTPAMAYVSGNLSITGNSTAVNFTDVLFYPVGSEGFFIGSNSRPINPAGATPASNMIGIDLNQTLGNFTASIPASAAGTMRYVMVAYANNGTHYYGAIQNFSLTVNNATVNATLRLLKGSYVTTNVSGDVNGTRYVVQLIDNQTGQPIRQNAGMIKFTANDYNDYGLLNYTIMVSANDSGHFLFTVLNNSNVTYSVFTMGKAPRKGTINTTLNAQNIQMRAMAFEDPGTGVQFNLSLMSIAFYLSNSTCDVKQPSSACLLTTFSPGSMGGPGNFNPLGFTLAGINVSLRISNLCAGVSVHLNNVDLIASGPPTPDFENNNVQRNGTGTQMQQAKKIGSFAPRVFSNAYVGMQLNTSVIDPSRHLYIRISELYNDEWQPLWNSSTDESGANVPQYFSDYNQSYFNATLGGVLCNTTDPNAVCFFNTTSGWVWFNVPHFSGTQSMLVGGGYEDYVLNISANDSSDPVSAGTNLTYRIFYNNTGNGTAYNVTFLSTFPNNTTYVTASPTPDFQNSTHARWNISSVAPNESSTINLTLLVNSSVYGGYSLTNTLFINATNATGVTRNTTMTVNTTVSTAPNITLNLPGAGAWTNQSTVDLNFTVVDYNSSTLNCSLYINNAVNQTNETVSNNTMTNFTVAFAEGFYLWNVSCWNNVTNRTGYSSTKNITVDLTQPAITLNSPINNYQGNDTSLTFNFTAVDSQSSTMNCSYYLNGIYQSSNSTTLNNTPTTFSSSGMLESHRNWSILCRDQANNSNVSVTNNLTLDQNAPSISINSPANNHVTNSSTVNFNFTATDTFNSTLNCSLYVNGAFNVSNTSIQNNTATNFSVTFAEGNHTWYIMCKDANNTNTTSARNLAVDLTVPSITMNAPVNNHFGNSSSIDFNFTVTDALSSTFNCSLYLDGTYNQSNTSTLNNTATIFSVSSITQGNHNWSILCRDQANNSNTTNTRNFSLDLTVPSITLNSPSNGYSAASSGAVTLTFNFSASDNNASTLNCTLYLDGSANYTNSSFTNGSSIATNISLSVNSHSWYVTCKDAVNNSNTSATYTISLSPSLPSSSTESPQYSMTLAAERNCPNNTVTVTTTSGANTELRVLLVDPYEGIIGSTLTADNKATFTISKAGTYQVTAIKPSYKLTTLTFSYSMCDVTSGNQTVLPPTTQPNVTTNITVPSNGTNVTPPVTPPVDQTKADADSAISATESAIAVAKNAGKNTTAAESKLAEAKTEYSTGNYTKAKQLADEALTLAQNAPALQQPATPPATTPATKTQDTKPKTDEGLLTGLGLLGLLLFIVVILAVVAGVYFFFIRKEGGSEGNGGKYKPRGK